MIRNRVVAVAVVYGDRWSLLKQVIDAVLKDDKVIKMIVVDNGSRDAEAININSEVFDERVIILRQEKNLGYSGAIHKGLAYARNIDCDFVFILDDDSVPEENSIDHFLNTLRLFSGKKVVLAGNRVNVPGNKKVFYRPLLDNFKPKGTLFDVFSLKKVLNTFRLILGIPRVSSGIFVPVVPMEAFVTGASFIPIEAVRQAPLPDERLFIYGEDLEYSWNIIRMGYDAYVCARPYIYDLDMTFPGNEGAHIFGLFDGKTPAYKVYFRIRNAVIISRRNTIQHPVVLLFNIMIWTTGLLLIGLFSRGFTKTYWGRSKLILQATWRGYFSNFDIPTSVKIPY